MSRRRRRSAAGTVAAIVAGLALGITGLAGAYSYWQSYYVHRGFAAVPLVRGAHRGHLKNMHFYSPALGRMANYLAYLPPGYQPGRRYPVYYMLHGSPGQPTVYLAIVSIGIRMDNLIGEHLMQPMILVFPNGEIRGSLFSDSEWANTPSGAFESYVVDVVHDVDTRLLAEPGRAHRVITGFSAGAYGATNIALHHLSVFGNLQSWSGYYLEQRRGVFAGASLARLAYNSPLDYVRRLRHRLARDPLRAFLFVGRTDEVSPQTIPMARALAAAGAQVSYALYPGGHDWQLWRAHVDQMLILASRDTTVPLTYVHGRAHTLTPGARATPRHHRHRHRDGRLHPYRLHSFGPRPSHSRPPAPPSTRPVLSRPLLSASTVAVPGPRGARGHRRDPGAARLAIGLLLALVSAVLINLGFLFQHRGLRTVTGESTSLLRSLRGVWRSQTWLAGQLLGWIGFGAQIAAVWVAPLALVQSFAAGGLALSVPIAARLFKHHITRRQAIAVLAIAVGLASLPIGFATGQDHLHGTTLELTVAACTVLALALLAGRSPLLRALAAGVFYGIADAAIKAISVGGTGALLSGWTALAALATFGGFLAFQAALRSGSAVSGMSVMNALSAVVALTCGVLAFEESLGTNPVAVIAHLVAIAVVLGCVPLLAEAQAAMAEPGLAGRERPGPRPLAASYQSSG